MTENQKKLAKSLFEIGAIKFGSFKLKLHETNPEAPLSPIYLDLRIVRSFPDVIRMAVAEMVNLIKEKKLTCDLIADLPTGATPFATLIMDRTSIPMITPKKDIKTHGISAKIEGVYKTGQKVLMIDDMVTKADTKIEGAKALRGAGLIVTDVVVLVDRRQGGAEELTKHNVTLHSVLTFPEMLNFCRDDDLIAEELLTHLKKYLNL